jgi:cytochrome oxidase Cu insertion factor (SCO1/SenC/PrrC family)
MTALPLSGPILHAATVSGMLGGRFKENSMRAMAMAAVFLVGTMAAPGTAQPEGGRPRLPPLLRADAPQVGDQLPDVQVFTDTGDPFRMSALKGKYTVLVFGCLT